MHICEKTSSIRVHASGLDSGSCSSQHYLIYLRRLAIDGPYKIANESC